MIRHDATKRYSKPSITSEDSFEDEAVVGSGGGDSVDGSAPVLGTCRARYPFTGAVTLIFIPCS